MNFLKFFTTIIFFLFLSNIATADINIDARYVILQDHHSQKILFEKGFVYIEVPDVAASIKGKNREEFYLDHLHVFSKNSLLYLARQNRLKKLIIAAKSAGADSIKLQMRDVLSFYSKEKLESEYISPFGTTFLEYRLGLELDDDQLLMVDNLCKELNINYFFSVLDKKSYYRLQKFKLDLLLSTIYPSMKKRFEKNLLSNTPSLFIFDLYRLSYLCYISRK